MTEQGGAAKPSKFEVYQNPALSAALTATSLQPSKSTLFAFFVASSFSTFALLSTLSRENELIHNIKLKNFSKETTYLMAKSIQAVVGLVFIGTLVGLFKALSLTRARNIIFLRLFSSKEMKDRPHLTKRQIELLGLKPKVEPVTAEASKKPPMSKTSPTFSDILVPVHQSVTTPTRSPRMNMVSNAGGGSKMHSVGTPSKSPVSSSSLYLVSAAVSPLPSIQNTPASDTMVSTPWSNKRGSSTKKITSEEKFEHFLAEVDEQITKSAGKISTPPSTISGFGIASPNNVASTANTSGTTRTTPLRPVRMSPSSQKYTTPPKKGDNDLPPPMSFEEAIESFKQLGIYPQIEQWRDNLRQWFSSVLLKPLLKKIESSHIQVMEKAAKLGISITVTQVGSDLPSETPATMSPIDRTKDWQPTFTLDEDGILNQLQTTLLQTINASTPKFPSATMQQSPQQNTMIPAMQECTDAITEHQRLLSLVKGELVKGLLPQSSVRADYTVQRIRELAEGTCLKNYEYLGSGEVYDKVNKKWSRELPTDSHLLLYLICAFLEHPKWMLHVEGTSYSGAQSSRNPLFLGILPPKERFPEKYIAVISGVPSTLHPGACILAVARQSPPTFALYWDKKLQFSLQGRTALWDSILLLCHKIEVGYGGIVRGMHLGSSALNILPVFEPENED